MEFYRFTQCEISDFKNYLLQNLEVYYFQFTLKIENSSTHGIQISIWYINEIREMLKMISMIITISKNVCTVVGLELK